MSFRTRLLQNRVVVAPGVYDPLTASLAAEAGFEALYLSGAAIAYAAPGRPDIGLVSMSEVADTIALVRDRVPTPLVVDADNGYGNALNVQRTDLRTRRRHSHPARGPEFPKRCGHLQDKSIIPAAEMAGKIQAAVDARASEETIIIARTDAVAVEGFEAAIERARLYAEAGADVLFVEAPKSREQLAAVTSALGSAPASSPIWSREGMRPVLRSGSRRSRFPARDLPGRHRPGSRAHRAGTIARFMPMGPTSLSANACSISRR